LCCDRNERLLIDTISRISRDLDFGRWNCVIAFYVALSTLASYASIKMVFFSAPASVYRDILFLLCGLFEPVDNAYIVHAHTTYKFQFFVVAAVADVS
jgi:hypothetical protein